MTPDIDGGEKALAGNLPCFSGDGYGYGGGATVTIGQTTILLGEGKDKDELARELARRWNLAAHPAPSTGNEGGADEIERINRESMQKREADLLRREGEAPRVIEVGPEANALYGDLPPTQGGAPRLNPLYEAMLHMTQDEFPAELVRRCQDAVNEEMTLPGFRIGKEQIRAVLRASKHAELVAALERARPIVAVGGFEGALRAIDAALAAAGPQTQQETR